MIQKTESFLFSSGNYSVFRVDVFGVFYFLIKKGKDKYLMRKSFSKVNEIINNGDGNEDACF